MKTIAKIFLAAVIISSTLLSSCGKYEEGPKISFASKKGRLTRKWTAEKYIDAQTGTEVTCNSNCDSYELNKDETVSHNGAAWANTKWQLSKDKEKLEFVTTLGSVVTTYSSKIIRLTSKELWLKDDTSGDQVHYKGD